MSARPECMATQPAKPAKGKGKGQRPLRARAWWVMRECGSFDLQELLLTVADGSERAAAENLRRYIRELGRAAVVLPAHGHDRYRLAADLGPKAPVIRKAANGKDTGLYDPNAGRMVPRAKH